MPPEGLGLRFASTGPFFHSEARLLEHLSDGTLAVIYSPYDLAGGWAMGQGPYNAGILPNDALAMGVNIMSHILLQ